MFNDLSATTLKQWFAVDFFSCRNIFLEQLILLENSSLYEIEKNQWTLPNSKQNLSCDAIYIGSRNAKKTLVFISGTHGVEGYCGSAIQSFILSNIAHQKIIIPQDTAVVMIHALNPWGMYWARRCDSEGIDINRNFIDFSKPLSTHKDYSQILDFLNGANLAIRQKKMQELVELWGQTHFDEVFSGGQFEYAWAPFFGGQQKSFSRTIIDEVIAQWFLPEHEIVVLDLHTGLGPWSYGEIISDHPLKSYANDFAYNILGETLAITEQGKSFSVKKTGLQDYRWHQLMQNSGCFLTLEFGTYGTDALFSVLLNEHLFWKNHRPVSLDDVDYNEHRKAMLKHFCPHDSLWQQAVIFKTLQVTHKFLEYFRE
jgi:Protein of unknown function (DUF2817)